MYKRQVIPNCNLDSDGRFGNQFIRNMASHFIAKRYNLKYVYSFVEQFKSMGIEFYDKGTNFYQQARMLNEELGLKYLFSNEPEFKPENMRHNVCLHIIFFQNPTFINFIKNYFNEPENKVKIIKANPFKQRYNAPFGKGNNDLFIHVRLGDVPEHSPGYDYYDKLIGEVSFTNGYIASDSIEHEICTKLIEKYNLKIFDKSEAATIQFASTCKYLVLSNGTFSWMMAFFAYFTEHIYYPKLKTIWHGDIYTGFDTWKCIEW